MTNLQHRGLLLVPVGLTVTLSLMITGCAQSGSTAAPAPKPPAGNYSLDPAIATAPSGTELPDGFSVAENTVLLGVAFPILVIPGPDEVEKTTRSGWTAQLSVLSDPIGVFNEYVAQSRDAGYEMRGGCSVDTPTSSVIPLDQFSGEDASLLRCSAAYYRASERIPVDFTLMAVDMYIGDIASGHPVATLNLTLGHGGDGSGDETPYKIGPPFAEVTGSVPALPASDAPPLPGPGEPIAPELSQRSGFLVVPKGAGLVALPTRGTRCTGGWDAILLTADPVGTLDDLEGQLKSVAEQPIVRSIEQRGDVLVTSFIVDPPGDDRIEVSSVAESDAAQILISAC